MDTETKIAIGNNMIALAKRKPSKRSRMLKMVMPMLSKELGEQLASAIADKNITKFKVVWDKIKADLADKIASQKTHAIASDVEEKFYFTLEASDLASYLDHVGTELAEEFIG